MIISESLVFHERMQAREGTLRVSVEFARLRRTKGADAPFLDPAGRGIGNNSEANHRHAALPHRLGDRRERRMPVIRVDIQDRPRMGVHVDRRPPCLGRRWRCLGKGGCRRRGAQQRAGHQHMASLQTTDRFGTDKLIAPTQRIVGDNTPASTQPQRAILQITFSAAWISTQASGLPGRQPWQQIGSGVRRKYAASAAGNAVAGQPMNSTTRPSAEFAREVPRSAQSRRTQPPRAMAASLAGHVARRE